MDATARLKHDHATITKVLAALPGLTAQQPLPVKTLRSAVAFSQTFVDRCHHGKEEGCLFPCLEGRGIPREGGPIGMMLLEHEMGRNLVHRIGQALDAFEAGNASPAAVVLLVDEYVRLLANHIAKEEGVLFQIADHVMANADDAQTVACYERTEAERTDEATQRHMRELALRIDQASRSRGAP